MRSATTSSTPSLEALETSGRQLWSGFNRRHSECVTRAKEALGDDGGPLVLTYRVNAGRLPDTHWYKDRRQGGRLLGEVCHFIDLASWVVGLPVDEVVAFGSRRAEALLQEDLVVTLRFADGSVAAITYAEFGHAGTSKERLEILGRGRSVVVDDFTRLLVDGKDVKLSRPRQGARREPVGVQGEPDRERQRLPTCGPPSGVPPQPSVPLSHCCRAAWSRSTRVCHGTGSR